MSDSRKWAAEQEIYEAQMRGMQNMRSTGLGQAQLGNVLVDKAPAPLVQQQMLLLNEELDRIHDRLRVLQSRLEPTVLNQAPTPANPAKEAPVAYPVGLAESVANLTRSAAAARAVICDILDRLEV